MKTVPFTRGFTLIELIVSVGLFSIVMMLVGGAYLVMIGSTRQAQAISSGMDNLSFALETMTRAMRTGGGYVCGGSGTSCVLQTSFQFVNTVGHTITYQRATGTSCGTSNGYNGCLQQTDGTTGVTSVLTDPSVNITSLKFSATGMHTYRNGQDVDQPYVTVIVQGNISQGPTAKAKFFTIESNAVMRGADL